MAIKKAVKNILSRKKETHIASKIDVLADMGRAGVHDAVSQLGWPQTLVLGAQHVFAMFGATVLVPLLTGLSISVTLFCAGIATLWFHLVTKGKVPVFLGSSFAFLGAFASIAPMINGTPNTAMLPYACGGIACAGLVYLVLSGFIKLFGAKKVMTLFPPVVTGPIIILIGIILAPSALNNCLAGSANGEPRWIISIVAIATIIVCNIWGKGLVKIVPILMGIIVSYVVAFFLGWTEPFEFDGIVKLPPFSTYSPLSGMKFEFNAILTCVVVAVAAIIEHVGDIAAIGETCGKNFIKDPGLSRTLIGDGIGTTIAGLLGGPANTTYSENTGVIVLSKVFDPLVVRIAAVFAIILSVIPAVDGAISTIPSEVIGGISFILYGMISAVGVRTLVEHKVDFQNQRNVMIAAIILVSGLAFNATPFVIKVSGVELTFGGLACAAILGIVLNAVLPGKDYVFKE